MYELIVLSLLMRTPAHGYLIARILNSIIGPYARASNGRLYPLLARLEQCGMIEIDEDTAKEQRSERVLRRYRITRDGRERFHTLMMDTTSNPGEYQRFFHLKVSVFAFLSISERLYLIDHYLNYCQAHVWHLTAERDDLATGNYHSNSDDDWLPATLDVMKHMAGQWQLEITWAQRLRTQEQARQEECDPSPEGSGRNESVDSLAGCQDQNQNAES